MVLCRRCIYFIACSIFIAAGSAKAEEFRSGEPVAFPFDGEWYFGRVVSVDQGRILISAERDGQTSQGSFSIRQVARPPGTTGYRFWSDTSGGFRVKAALVDVADQHVRLRKQDGSEVTVPISKLSDNDQQLIDRAKEAKAAYAAKRAVNVSPPVAGGIAAGSSPTSRYSPGQELKRFPPAHLNEPDRIVDTTLSADVTIDCDDQTRDRDDYWEGSQQPITMADRAAVDLPQAYASYPRVLYERVSRMLPVGGDQGWVLCGVKNSAAGNLTEAGLRWLSLSKRSVSGVATIRLEETLFDYEPSNHHVLTVSGRQGTGDTPTQWTVYELAPGSIEPKVVASLEPSGWSWGTSKRWGKLIAGSKALLMFPDRLALVDYASGDIPLEIKFPSLGSVIFDPELSPDERYVLLRFTSSYWSYRLIVDLESRETIHLTRARSGKIGQESFSKDGRHLISVGRGRVRWIDLQSWKIVRSESVGLSMQTPEFRTLNDRFAVSEARLIDFKTNSSVIRFSFLPHRADSTSVNAWFNDDRLLATAEDSRSKVNWVGCYQLPGEPLMSFLEDQVYNGAYPALKPGGSVRLALPDVQTDRVKDVLEAVCRENDWKIDDESRFVLSARETIPPVLRRLRDAGEKFAFIIEVKLGERIVWDERSSDYLIVTRDEISYGGAIGDEDPGGAVPAGLEVPSTIIAYARSLESKSSSYRTEWANANVLPFLYGQPTTISTK